MNTLKGLFEADSEGIVHVRLPIGKPGRRLEVLVVWEESSSEEVVSPEEDWSDLFGLLKDVPLERPSQGEYEKRDELG